MYKRRKFKQKKKFARPIKKIYVPNKGSMLFNILADYAFKAIVGRERYDDLTLEKISFAV